MSNTRRFSNFETYPKQSTSISSANFNNFPTNFDQLDRKHYINSGPEYGYCSKSMPTSPRLFQLKRNSISTVESNESIFYLKERCLELELQLEKTRNQMLQMKTCYQNKILDMQRKMIELDDENLESKKNSIMLENGGNEIIEKLRIELEEEKQRRVEDAKQVEIKANQIKDWVLDKLRKLEEENRILTERNKELEKLHHDKNNDILSRQESVEQEFEAVVESLKYLSSIVENDQKKNGNDYADVFTSNTENRSNWNTNLKNRISNESESSEATATLANEILFLDDKPPTPPLHRCPSWERKIYEVANESITEKSALLSDGRRQIDQSKIVEDIKTIGPNRNINIPVYATVKGRASQIRSVPFTGESTDDEEEDSSDYGLPNNDNVYNGNSNRNKMVASSNFDVPSSNCQIVSDPSFESGISDDYAIPPDAYSCSSSSTISGVVVADTYTSSMYPTQQLQKQQSIISLKSTRSQNSSFEKSGHLSKLGGKLKTWRKYWFSVSLNTNSKLLYWKNQPDSLKKHPHGTIVISTFTRINRGDAANFEIATDTKNYYFTADSVTSMEDWVRVLQNIQRKNATSMLLQNQEENQTLIQGWVKKVKNGRIKHCWCVLIGKMLLYFKNNNTTVPLGEIDLRDAKVEEIIQNSDSDCDEMPILEPSSECPLESFNIGIFSSYGQSPTYLLFQSKHDYLNWLYHLTIVSGSGSSIGTQYEQLVQKLMECAGDNDSIVWRHPLLLYSKENIGSPLTSLNSEALQSEAVKLFKCCQLFMSVAVEQAGIDYHVILAQNALQQCLDVTDLQNELFCALIKQTSVSSSNNSSLATKQTIHEKNSTNYTKQSQQQQQQQQQQRALVHSQPETNFSLIQGWQLLALACSLFVPRNSRILWYLKTHLVRNSNNKTECGKYATYCNRALQRTIKNGDRLMKPSRMEVLSLLLKNPFHHSLPHAIPVHMLNNSYQVTGFDGSTTIEEFLNTLSQEVGCRSSRENGFTLFSDDPLEKSIEHCLEPEAKLCDVISKWETALREKGMGKFENSRIIKLTYKNRLYWKQSTIKMETDREKQLICYQTNLQIVQGQFPVSRDLALELASLMAQIDLGDFHVEKTKNKVFMRTALERFYPERYLECSNGDFIRELEEKLQAKWTALKGRSILDCVRIYLTCARKWQFFGASLFETYSKQLLNEKQTILSCWIAVTESSVSILDFNSMNIIAEYMYASIVTFGGCQNDFMLVVEDYSQRRQFSSNQSSSRKLLFSLPKPKILDITLLIADYMNALKQATLPLAGPHKRPKFIQELYLNIAAQQPDILKSVLDS